MTDTARIGAALAGGYVLGRTKKAKKAITLALWLSGKQPSGLSRTALTRLRESQVAGEILTQLRGPLTAAATRAALALVEGRVTSLADNLHQRTDALQATAVRTGTQDDEETPDEAADTASDAPAEQSDSDEPRDDQQSASGNSDDRSAERAPTGRQAQDRTSSPQSTDDEKPARASADK